MALAVPCFLLLRRFGAVAVPLAAAALAAAAGAVSALHPGASAATPVGSFSPWAQLLALLAIAAAITPVWVRKVGQHRADTSRPAGAHFSTSDPAPIEEPAERPVETDS